MCNNTTGGSDGLVQVWRVRDDTLAARAFLNYYSNESTKVQNPRRKFIYTMRCLTLNSKCRGPSSVQAVYIYTAHARTSASPVSRLFHAGCTSS